MIINKKYHFYAAHRNELLNDKCFNLHGHVYRIEVFLKMERDRDGITILFNDIDKFVEPIIEKFDHCCIVHKKDEKLVQALETLGTKKYIMTMPTTVENLSVLLYNLLENEGLPMYKIKVMETESSTIFYSPYEN